MKNEHQIVKAVYAAKEDLQKADDLIRQYMPFIVQMYFRNLYGAGR